MSQCFNRPVGCASCSLPLPVCDPLDSFFFPLAKVFSSPPLIPLRSWFLLAYNTALRPLFPTTKAFFFPTASLWVLTDFRSHAPPLGASSQNPPPAPLFDTSCELPRRCFFSDISCPFCPVRTAFLPICPPPIVLLPRVDCFSLFVRRRLFLPLFRYPFLLQDFSDQRLDFCFSWCGPPLKGFFFFPPLSSHHTPFFYVPEAFFFETGDRSGVLPFVKFFPNVKAFSSFLFFFFIRLYLTLQFTCFLDCSTSLSFFLMEVIFPFMLQQPLPSTRPQRPMAHPPPPNPPPSARSPRERDIQMLSTHVFLDCI